MNDLVPIITDEKHYIYRITNLINGKVYIGQTNNLRRRWNEHKSFRNGTTIIAKAINKHGSDNFSFKCIEICDSLTESNLQEAWQIMINNSLVPIGYNVELGGSVNKHTQETLDKIAASNRGKIRSLETKKKLSDSHKGHKPSKETLDKLSKIRKGRIVSEETKKKMSQAKLGKIVTKKTRDKISNTLKGKNK